MFTEEVRNELNNLIELKNNLAGCCYLKKEDWERFKELIDYEHGEFAIKENMINIINARITKEFEKAVF